jgi:hypothetical protein
MKNLLSKMLIAALAVVVMTGSGWAGLKISSAVFISTTNSYAYGSMGSARASADANQNIGCDSYNSGGSSLYGYCHAQDSAGLYKQCFWQGASYASTVASAAPGSSIWFYWDTNGNCTFIEVSNGSQYAPLTP